MLIHRLKVAGLLSFGPSGIDLPLEPLNVLIGPNGSGKSNLLEAIVLLQAAPRGITEPISRVGGVPEWLWKGPDAPQSITMETIVDYPHGGVLRHSLTITTRNGRLEVTNEQVEPSENHPEQAGLSYYRPPQDELAALEIAKANAKAEQTDAGRKRRTGEWSHPTNRSKTSPRSRRLRK